MSEIATASAVSEGIETSEGDLREGKLLTSKGERSVVQFAETEEASAAVSRLIQEANVQKPPEKCDFKAQQFHAQETVKTYELEKDIQVLLDTLNETPEKVETKDEKGKTESKADLPRHEAKTKSPPPIKMGISPKMEAPQRRENHGSLFSLASKMHTEAKPKAPVKEKGVLPHAETKIAPQSKQSERVAEKQPEIINHLRVDRDGGGGHGKQQQEQEKRQQQKTKVGSVSKKSPTEQLNEAGSLYIMYMEVMGRILGQAERDGHELYKRIKSRTDQVDVLTLLTSKINAADGKIDWSKDEEMKALVDQARGIGVTIPENTYSWSEEEKKLLKENIQMRKDSMEKLTQLERTDMQRFLQESSQCHQARSNILKLLKEVVDLFVNNIRPH